MNPDVGDFARPLLAKESGISVAAIQESPARFRYSVFASAQSIATLRRRIVTQTMMHGSSRRSHHADKGVFKGLPNPLTRRATIRWRSTARRCPTARVTAWTDDGEIMGVQHKTLAWKVQFIQSIMTERGHDLLRHFIQGIR